MVKSGGPAVLEIVEEELGGFGGFPDRLYLCSVGPGLYAANNATAPDGTMLDGLASFPTLDDGTTYMSMPLGMSGELVAKSFDEAREIAKSKPKINSLLLFVAGRIVEIHFVR